MMMNTTVMMMKVMLMMMTMITIRMLVCVCGPSIGPVPSQLDSRVVSFGMHIMSAYRDS